MKQLIRIIFSRPLFQPLFEMILLFTLKVLNIGEGHTVSNSGEKYVFSILGKIFGQKNILVFDVGAHTGEWSENFVLAYHGDYSLYMFEPSKKSFDLLERSRALWQRNNKYHYILEHCALGERNGTAALEADFYGSTEAFVSSGSQNNTHSVPTQRILVHEDISIITLDSYCEKNGITRIDFLKLDIEGYELNALAGARQMIQNGAISLIQFEFGAPSKEEYSLKAFYNLLGDQYVIHRILAHGIYPLENYRHYHEIHTVTNFLAVKKSLISCL
jgi:FkbM family methyltransferase